MIIIVANIHQTDAAILAAVEWMAATLLGSVETAVAFLAVVFLGFGMLFGHLDWRAGSFGYIYSGRCAYDRAQTDGVGAKWRSCWIRTSRGWRYSAATRCA